MWIIGWLEETINSDLANNFGNLCQRVTAFCEKDCSSLIPDEINFIEAEEIIRDKSQGEKQESKKPKKTVKTLPKKKKIRKK